MTKRDSCMHILVQKDTRGVLEHTGIAVRDSIEAHTTQEQEKHVCHRLSVSTC